MKKKGFTLIELLAVIVILAIIALIATPLVLKYIEKSRQESKVDSAYSFIRNLETEIANYSIKHNGKKYNKSGLVEIGDLTDIDATLKGDNPTNVKIVLSDLGQVEKGVFEFDDGKYYVIYDGKAASITNEETYNSFNDSDSGSQSDYLFNEDTVNFSYDSNQGKYVGTYDFGDQELPNFQTYRDYELIINDGESIDVYYIFGMLGNDNGEVYAKIQDGVLQVFSSNELNGNQNVKIKYSSEYIPYMVRIHSSGDWYLYSLEFMQGTAHVKITDSNGEVYYNEENVIFIEDGFFVGTDVPNHEGLSKISDVYTALSNGKVITITVTQTESGKEVTTTIGGINPEFIENTGMMFGSAYYFGNSRLKKSFS